MASNNLSFVRFLVQREGWDRFLKLLGTARPGRVDVDLVARRLQVRRALQISVRPMRIVSPGCRVAGPAIRLPLRKVLYATCRCCW